MSQPALQVSVVAATHNRPTRLQALLESLRSQTLDPSRFEVIIVDDGSECETADLLERELQRAQLRLRVLRREGPGGPAAARNDGWRVAAAPLIAFIDDDCVAAPRWLEEGLRACAALPEGIVQGHVDPIPAERAIESPFTRTLRIHRAGPYYQTCNIFYPRRLLSELDGFDAEAFTLRGEDTDLAWRAISRGTPTAFAADARVYHAVSAIGPLGRLRVAWLWSESMQAYKRYPELRKQVFLKRIFWKPWHYTLLRALLALLVPRRWRALRLWLTLPYVISIETRCRFEGGTILHAFFYPVEDAVEIAAMLRASVRYRMLVL